MVIWLIGLAGAGKTVIGLEVYSLLKMRKPNVVFIDGDAVRSIMGHDLGHTVEDRRVNAWRVCRLCKYLDEQGIDVVCAILSMFAESRSWNRENYSDYFEVYIDVPMEELIARDQKGLYSDALAGRTEHVVGVDIPFEPPSMPDLTVHNGKPLASPSALAEQIILGLDGKLQ